MGKDKSILKPVKGLKEIVDWDPATVVMIYRRVNGDMFKQFGLKGYETDMLIFVIKLSKYTIGNVVTGPQIRKKATKKFSNVMRPIADKLVSLGYLEYLYADGESRFKFKLGMTEKAVDFAHAWRMSINKHLEADEAELVLNARFSWEKKKRREVEGLGE